MPQLEVTLPSGARGKIRGLKGSEINLFANRTAARSGKTSLQVLRNVWVETTEPGPAYQGPNIDWSKALGCDRFVALFKARIATYGPEYNFHYQCEDCRSKFEWELDLNELDVKPLPESTIEKISSGSNAFDGSVMDPEGQPRKLVFQLLTPNLEKRIEQEQRRSPEERATAALAQRIVSIEGCDGRADIKAFLKDLDAGPMFDLIADMDDADGGIETLIEIDCPHCSCAMEVDLPLEGEFWNPSRRKRSSKR